MTRIGIVLPTVAGRAQFDTVLDAYEKTCPRGWEFDIAIPEDYPTVGEAWNSARDDVDGEYLHFAIDDAEPHAGWAETAVETAEAGFMPAAHQTFPDGSLECCGSMGGGMFLPYAPDWTPCRSTGVPFMRAEWWSLVGEFLPIHYYCDDDYHWRACCEGIKTVYRSGYRFTHHHDRAATGHVVEAARAHQAAFLEHAAALLGGMACPR